MTYRAVNLVAGLALSIATVGLGYTAELSPAEPQNEQSARMPAESEFTAGPEGGGAVLSTKIRVPTVAEFTTGPEGGAIEVPPGSEKLIPGSTDFTNGPVGIQK